MDRSLGVVLTAFAGGLVALQAPINSKLGKTIGTLPAATVSFALGLVVLTTLTVLVGGGFGDVGKAGSLPWYYLLGGVLGAVYVTTVLVAVRTLGAGGITAATVAGLWRYPVKSMPRRSSSTTSGCSASTSSPST